MEKETKERRAELQRYEKRVLSKEENVEKKADALEKKEADLVRRENILGERTAEVEAQYEQGIQELNDFRSYLRTGKRISFKIC